MRPPGLCIDSVLSRGRRLIIEDVQVLEGANFVLRRFAKRVRLRQPRVLVVAPCSGHFGWLMRDTVQDLLTENDLWLLEWLDARDIPVSAGRLALDSCILAIMAALRTMGPGTTVLGVSQAPLPILAATALMAAHAERERPAAMVLMGGFIDPRGHPTAVERMTARLPPGWFNRTVAQTVPDGFAGAGRRIYPATLHAQALTRYLGRHMAAGGELLHKLTEDDGSDPVRFPFLRLYSTLMDLPAEFAEDNARLVFAESRLARGLLSCAGRLVEPHRITDTALMTVEGGADDSSGPGHTHAAHGLCPAIPAVLREKWTEPAAGHFGLFHGEPWRSSIMPRICAFMRGTASSSSRIR